MSGAEQQRLRFFEAAADCTARRDGGIGTLGEKTLHVVMKKYCQPDTDCHEIRVDRYVADICDGNGITEIQTRGFDRLRAKLQCFLAQGRVTVVYPVAMRKYLFWMDTAGGTVTARRKSPKTGAACDVLPELYKIKNLLTHPNFRLRVVLLEIDEYRLLDGWSGDGKKGSTRYERIPTDFFGEVCVETTVDWHKLLPDGLPQTFTTADFAAACARNRRFAQTALCVLYAVGAVERIGKQGNTYLYRENNARPPSGQA